MTISISPSSNTNAHFEYQFYRAATNVRLDSREAVQVRRDINDEQIGLEAPEYGNEAALEQRLTSQQARRISQEVQKKIADHKGVVDDEVRAQAINAAFQEYGYGQPYPAGAQDKAWLAHTGAYREMTGVQYPFNGDQTLPVGKTLPISPYARGVRALVTAFDAGSRLMGLESTEQAQGEATFALNAANSTTMADLLYQHRQVDVKTWDWRTGDWHLDKHGHVETRPLVDRDLDVRAMGMIYPYCTEESWRTIARTRPAQPDITPGMTRDQIRAVIENNRWRMKLAGKIVDRLDSAGIPVYVDLYHDYDQNTPDQLVAKSELWSHDSRVNLTASPDEPQYIGRAYINGMTAWHTIRDLKHPNKGGDQALKPVLSENNVADPALYLTGATLNASVMDFANPDNPRIWEMRQSGVEGVKAVPGKPDAKVKAWQLDKVHAIHPVQEHEGPYRVYTMPDTFAGMWRPKSGREYSVTTAMARNAPIVQGIQIKGANHVGADAFNDLDPEHRDEWTMGPEDAFAKLARLRHDAPETGSTLAPGTSKVGAAHRLSLIAGHARRAWEQSLDLDRLQAAMAGDTPPDRAAQDSVAHLQDLYWQLGHSDEPYDEAGDIVLPDPHRPDRAWQPGLDLMVKDPDMSVADYNMRIMRAHAQDTATALFGRPLEHRDWLEPACNPLDNAIGGHHDEAGQIHVDAIREFTGNWAVDRITMVNAMRTLRMDRARIADPDTFEGARMCEDTVPVAETDQELVSSDNFLNRLGETDPTYQYWRKTFAMVKGALRDNGVSDPKLAMESAGQTGVIHWKGTIREGADGKTQTEVHGLLGQFFPINERTHTMQTHYDNDRNVTIIPGYHGHIRRNRGFNETLAQRTLAYSPMQEQARKVKAALRKEMCVWYSEDRGSTFGLDLRTAVNPLYRDFSDHLDADWYETHLQAGMSPELLDRICATQAGRVRYDSEYENNATVFAFHSQLHGPDPWNTNHDSGYSRAGYANMAVLGDDGAGYFDPVFTPVTNTTQGLTRYLVEGASVDTHGIIHPVTLTVDGKEVPDEDARAPIMGWAPFKTTDHDPADRANMAFSNLLHGSSTLDCAIAYMPAGGWNQDDGFVVSRAFADRARTMGADGQPRALRVGDKLCDQHGNKGVISLIVDPDTVDDTTQPDSVRTLARVVADNPGLDVIASPASPPSRQNAGSAVEIIDNPDSGPRDLVLRDPDGNPRTVKGGIGTLAMTVTDKSVDTKTTIYTQDEYLAGRGRKTGAQFAWGLQASGATRLMRHLYGRGLPQARRMADILRAVGHDLDMTGRLYNQARDVDTLHDVERPYEFQFPDYRGVTTDHKGRDYMVRKGTPRFAAAENPNWLSNQLASHGGVARIPFPLWGKAVVPGDDGKFKAQPLTRGADGQWQLHILPPTARGGIDDDTLANALSRHYKTILANADAYRQIDMFQQAMNGPDSGTSEQQWVRDRMMLPDFTSKDYKGTNPLEDAKQRLVRESQSAYRRVCATLESYVTHRRNLFKEQLMSQRQPDSATMVWSENPTLGLDEVAMSRTTMDQLHVGEGEHVLVWRDPILRDGGIRMLKAVAAPDTQTGIAINPAAATSFDGDFDGDTVAVVRVGDKEAYQDAMEHLSQSANLLMPARVMFDDQGKPRTLTVDGKDTGVPLQPLYFGQAIDTALAKHHDPDLADRFDRAMVEANETRWLADQKAIDPEAARQRNEHTLETLNGLYRQAFTQTCAMDALSFETPGEHVASIDRLVVSTGMKGNRKKLAEYAAHAGITMASLEGDGPLDPAAYHYDRARVVSSRERMESHTATANKNHDTGMAGGFAHRAVTLYRQNAIGDMLACTQPLTQSVLDSKKDAAEARHKDDMVRGALSAAWKGVKFEPVELPPPEGMDAWPANWKGTTVRWEESGRCTGREWADQMHEMITRSTRDGGMNIPDMDRAPFERLALVATGGNLDNPMPDYTSTETLQDTSPLDRLAYQKERMAGDKGRQYRSGHELICVITGNRPEGVDLYANGCEVLMPEQIAENRRLMAGQMPGWLRGELDRYQDVHRMPLDDPKIAAGYAQFELRPMTDPLCMGEQSQAWQEKTGRLLDELQAREQELAEAREALEQARDAAEQAGVDAARETPEAQSEAAAETLVAQAAEPPAKTAATAAKATRTRAKTAKTAEAAQSEAAAETPVARATKTAVKTAVPAQGALDMDDEPEFDL